MQRVESIVDWAIGNGAGAVRWWNEVWAWWLHLDRGNLAEWAGVVVTGAAFFVAYQLYRVEQGRDLRRDQQLAQERQAAEQAVQADLVAAWPALIKDEVSTTTVTGIKKVMFIHQTPGAVVSNASALPIFDVATEFITPGGARTPAGPLRVLRPGETKVRWTEAMGNPPDVDDWEGSVLVGVTFRDTANRIWTRDPWGLLSFGGMSRRNMVPPSSGGQLTGDGTLSTGVPSPND